MSTLHILRSKPDGQVKELIRAITKSKSTQITLYEESVDYHSIVEALFSHDRVISWW